jgi:transcriptional antiterminator RfaH
MADQYRWFCARHNAGEATWALLNLKYQGFVTHRPTFPERIVRRNKVITMDRPVFPGYVFVWFTLSNRKYVAINSTYGVSRLLPTRCSRPVPLPVGFVETLQSREPSAPVVAEVIATFAANAIVRILAGAFHGKLGTVISSGPRSTRLLLKAFGRDSTTVTLSTADLALAPIDEEPS